MSTQTLAYWVLVFGYGGGIMTIAASDWKYPWLWGVGTAGTLGLLFAFAGGMLP